MTMKQFHFQQVFQVGQQLRHARLGHANGLSGAFDAAQFSEANQDFEMSKPGFGHQAVEQNFGGN